MITASSAVFAIAQVLHSFREQCSRRKQPDSVHEEHRSIASTGAKEDESCLTCIDIYAKRAMSIDAESNNDSTDDADTGDGSTHGSETDRSYEDNLVGLDAASLESTRVSISSIGPPPGLDLIGSCIHKDQPMPDRDTAQTVGTPLSALAPPFVPSRGQTVSEEHPTSVHDVICKLSAQDRTIVMESLSLARRGPQAIQSTDFHSGAVLTSGQTTSWKVPTRNAGRKVGTPGITLRENLLQVSSFDPECVILVRKINRLGLNSPQLLEIYFSQFGPVERVLISHSIDKPNEKRRHPRWRPAGLGFIAMRNAQDAAAAIGHASEHIVLGVHIVVAPYEDHYAEKMLGVSSTDEGGTQQPQTI